MSKSSQVPSRALVCALLVSILPALSYAVTADRILGAIDSSKTVALQESRHPKAQEQYDRGPVDSSFKILSMTLMTTPSTGQQRALDKLVAEQQDRTSANYHKWLTPAQYADRFGLSQNDMNRITSWLKAQGFVIQSIGGGRNTVKFSGTAAQVQNAFKAEIHHFNVNGEEHFANATPLLLPAAVQGIVTGIAGVNDFRMHTSTRFQPGFGPKSRSDYYDGTFSFPNFLAPADIATIYDINALYTANPVIDGSGESIAIVGRSDIFLEDINDYRSAFGLTPISASNCTLNTATSTTAAVITACNDPHFKYVLVLPTNSTDPLVPDSRAAGDIGEADLDIEISGAVAPNAQIVYINSPRTDVADSLSYAINPPAGTPIPAQVVSMSFGLCELDATFFETELQQAASEGITVVNSTGDVGAAGCDGVPPNATPPFHDAVGGLAVSYPASSTWVTAVGGTSITLAEDSFPGQNSTYWGTSDGSSGIAGYGGTAKSHIPEIGWNDDELFAQFCLAIANPSGNAFCKPSPGVLITSQHTAQQDYWIASGGGGASNCVNKNLGTTCAAPGGGFSQPTWQQSLVLTNAAIPTGVRWVPDVSFMASADFPGYIFCTPQNPDATTPTYTSTCVNGISGLKGAVEGFNSVIGGTSVSAPLFAGIVALLNQYLAGPSSPGLGLINPTLYKLAATPSNGAFNQVTTGDNMAYCQAHTPSAQPPALQCPAAGIMGYSASGAGNFDPTTGYNLVTGLGSVDAFKLAQAWGGSRTVTSLSISPSTNQLFLGQSVTLTATLSSTTATGNVLFFNNNSASAFGTAAVSGGTATLATTALPVGSDSVTATYGGDNSNSPSTASAVSLTVTSPFTLSVNTNNFTVSQGQSVSIPVTVTLTSGFSGTVAFSCPSPGAEITCTSPPQTNTSGPVSFQVLTIAPSAMLQRPFERTQMFYAVLLPGLLGVVFTFGSRKRSLHGMRMLGLLMVMGASTIWLGSCSNSSNNSTKNPGTPKGVYAITMTGTSGTYSAHQAVHLTVQ
jgi:subtilase family serine protease